MNIPIINQHLGQFQNAVEQLPARPPTDSTRAFLLNEFNLFLWNGEMEQMLAKTPNAVHKLFSIKNEEPFVDIMKPWQDALKWATNKKQGLHKMWKLIPDKLISISNVLMAISLIHKDS